MYTNSQTTIGLHNIFPDTHILHLIFRGKLYVFIIIQMTFLQIFTHFKKFYTFSKITPEERKKIIVRRQKKSSGGRLSLVSLDTLKFHMEKEPNKLILNIRVKDGYLYSWLSLKCYQIFLY